MSNHDDKRGLEITSNFEIGVAIVRDRIALEIGDGVRSEFFAFNNAEAALNLADELRLAVGRLSKESLNQRPVRAVEDWIQTTTGETTP